jgi:hypothetical protein
LFEPFLMRLLRYLVSLGCRNLNLICLLIRGRMPIAEPVRKNLIN